LEYLDGFEVHFVQGCLGGHYMMAVTGRIGIREFRFRYGTAWCTGRPVALDNEEYARGSVHNTN
jgi:hypothetical protein